MSNSKPYISSSGTLGAQPLTHKISIKISDFATLAYLFFETLVSVSQSKTSKYTSFITCVIRDEMGGQKKKKTNDDRLSSQSSTPHHGPILQLDLNQQGQGDQVRQAVVEAVREVDGEAGEAGAGVEVVVVAEDS